MLANVDHIKNLINSIYGSRLEYFKNREASLPLYLTEDRWFCDVSISGTEFVVIGIDLGERFSIDLLIKQGRKYVDAFSRPVVYAFSAVTSYQRKALIENEIAFISVNEQVCLPFLGSVFSKASRNLPVHQIDSFSPSYQMLFLFLLYQEKEKSFNKSRIAEQLHISAMSITRAAAALKELELIKEEKQGRDVYLSLALNRMDAYRKAEAHLMNPVQEVIYLRVNAFENGIRAGEYSLSERSEFGYPSYKEYAVFGKSQIVSALQSEDPGIEMKEKLIRVQIWRYDPSLFTSTNDVDPVSLISSFQNEDDERIHKCLKRIEGEITSWQITKN